jgi:hypothetical protein
MRTRGVLAALPRPLHESCPDPRLPHPDQGVLLAGRGAAGSAVCGVTRTVAQKIAANLPALGATRFDLKYGIGGLFHAALMRAIDLYGTQVVPRVRELLGDAAAQPLSAQRLLH